MTILNLPTNGASTGVWGPLVNAAITTVRDVADQGVADAASARVRSNHTGQQTASTISDFTEAAQDAVAALLASGTGVTLTYNDAGNTLTVTSTATGGSTDPEVVRDTIGAALIGVGAISVAVNDAADTITITTTATTNATDAALRDRSTHTGFQAISTITNLQTALDAKAPLASPTFTGTVTGITAAMVGLGSVNNTADSAKPVSTAQQTALDAKTSKTYVDSADTALSTRITTLENTQVHSVALLSDIPGGAPVGSIWLVDPS